MAKTLCDWSKKDIEGKQVKLQALTNDACFYCRKCARVANQSKSLCRAVRFSRVSMSEPNQDSLEYIDAVDRKAGALVAC